jgi:hypothetical protein
VKAPKPKTKKTFKELAAESRRSKAEEDRKLREESRSKETKEAEDEVMRQIYGSKWDEE